QQNDIDSMRAGIDRYGKFVNIGDEDGRTPLHYAAEKGSIDIIRLLLELYDANIYAKDKDRRMPYIIPMLNGHFDVVNMLIEGAEKLGLDGMQSFCRQVYVCSIRLTICI